MRSHIFPKHSVNSSLFIVESSQVVLLLSKLLNLDFVCNLLVKRLAINLLPSQYISCYFPSPTGELFNSLPILRKKSRTNISLPGLPGVGGGVRYSHRLAAVPGSCTLSKYPPSSILFEYCPKAFPLTLLLASIILDQTGGRREAPSGGGADTPASL